MKTTLSQIPLIPRKLLLGNPSRIAPRLSPDGRSLSWLAPFEGVLNIWVALVDALGDAVPVTRMKGRPIYGHYWSPDGRFLMFARDENGDENDRFYVADAETGETRCVTPFDRIRAELLRRSRDLPGKVILGLNNRDARWHDAYELDIATGALTLIYENTDRFGILWCDWQGRVRLGSRSNPENGGDDLFRFRDGRPEHWRSTPFEDALTTSPGYFNRAGGHFAMISSVGRDTAALLRVDFETAAETVLYEHEKADVTDFLLDRRSFEVTAAAADPGRLVWTALDPEVGRTFDLIRSQAPGADFGVYSATDDDARWIATVSTATDPATYYLIDRTAGTMRELFSALPELKSYRLSGMETVTIKARDGLDLVSYLTLPPDEPGPRPRKPLPLVLEVHGGPWARDDFGYRRDHQWFANRGYAALSVNYRGSTGFGKAFVNAGDKEHAAKIHDDLLDGVEWAISEGIALREKIAITGWSYGGYSSFVAATFTPDVFCCAIPVVGITDLVTLMENRPPYWADAMETFNRRYADVRTEEGRAFLRSRSPLYKVDAIRKPMLIGHGANDVRCTLAQSDLIVASMTEKGIPVTYVVFPDEGHGFARPENNIAFHAIFEQFLARHLGGRAEPVGDDSKGSSYEIRAGADILTEPSAA